MSQLQHSQEDKLASTSYSLPEDIVGQEREVPQYEHTSGLTEETIYKAGVYLADLKLHLSRNHALYNEFLDVIRDFRLEKYDRVETIQKVVEILCNSSHFVLRFNDFLPDELQITVKDGDYVLYSPLHAPMKLHPFLPDDLELPPSNL